MSKIVDYFKDVHQELIVKTSWPTWKDLTNSARIVMVAAVIIALIVFVMDFAFDHILKFVYDLFYVG